MDAKLIGLAGQQGAGKDFMFAWFKDYMATDGLVTRRVAFADGVRREIQDVLTYGNPGVSKLSILWQKPYPAEIRWLLQQWGTELRRAEDPDYWVKRGLEYAGYMAEHADLLCFTDVRFENEAEAIREAGGIVVHVLAKDEVRAERLGLTMEELAERSQHASEEIDFQVDGYVINNDEPDVDPDIWRYLNA